MLVVRRFRTRKRESHVPRIYPRPVKPRSVICSTILFIDSASVPCVGDLRDAAWNGETYERIDLREDVAMRLM